MTIADRMIRTLVDRGDIGLVLTNDRQAVTNALTPEHWNTGGGDASASASVVFGPFADRVVADGVGVMVGGTVEYVIPLTGRMELPVGMTFGYEATLLAEDR